MNSSPAIVRDYRCRKQQKQKRRSKGTRGTRTTVTPEQSLRKWLSSRRVAIVKTTEEANALQKDNKEGFDVNGWKLTDANGCCFNGVSYRVGVSTVHFGEVKVGVSGLHFYSDPLEAIRNAETRDYARPWRLFCVKGRGVVDVKRRAMCAEMLAVVHEEISEKNKLLTGIVISDNDIRHYENGEPVPPVPGHFDSVRVRNDSDREWPPKEYRDLQRTPILSY
jgi:hypothetical protein